jgi:gamma-glutamyl:cysteine ligase YbdK (ATP-grasp superfamily)
MGEEISNSRFTQHDFTEFHARLIKESGLLRQWFAEHCFSRAQPTGGFEVEAWLIDRQARPVPFNESFLDLLKSPLVVPELAQFNVEINTAPLLLGGDSLRKMQANLTATWERCNQAAFALDMELLMVGILPTVLESELNLNNMSSKERYRALNEQVFRLRRHKPIPLNIEGLDHLLATHTDVMLEAAATSFQIHLQVSQQQSVRFYNAAMVVSAPMVALAANSPYLFGRDLWDETRIPLFEQAVGLTNEKMNRVSFGSGYVRESLLEHFLENLDSSTLLPMLIHEPARQLSHLRLHNGTIWRWNRPLIGFDTDGTPHLRIEHRVLPAGPSLIDVIANAAFFFGLLRALGTAPLAPESLLSFQQARENFYAAAKNGLNCSVVWLNGRSVSVRQLLLEELVPLARRGLEDAGFLRDDITLYLSVIEGRLASGQNGAAWQRAYVKKHGKDMLQLTCAYRDHQRSGEPVHQWTL